MDDDRAQCSTCSSFLRYQERFDAVYCPACDEWQETKCGDPRCRFCSERPRRPSLADEMIVRERAERRESLQRTREVNDRCTTTLGELLRAARSDAKR